MLKGTKFNNNLAIMAIILIFGYFFYISSTRFPVSLMKDIGDIKMALINVLMIVMGYFFGSSKSKDNITPNGIIFTPSKPKKKMQDITGYYIDIPEGGQMIDSINGDHVGATVDQYTGATYTAETSTHYGLLEWDNTTAIEEIYIDGQPVNVQSLIGGQHPIARPK